MLSANATARCEAALGAAAKKSYRQLLTLHVTDHQQLFRRVKLDLGQTEAMNQPTDERLKAIREGGEIEFLVYGELSRLIDFCG